MKLYEVNNNTKVRIAKSGRWCHDALGIQEGEKYMFHHIDGMYSYCKDKNNQVVHLKAWTEVELVIPEKHA